LHVAYYCIECHPHRWRINPKKATSKDLCRGAHESQAQSSDSGRLDNIVRCATDQKCAQSPGHNSAIAFTSRDVLLEVTAFHCPTTAFCVLPFCTVRAIREHRAIETSQHAVRWPRPHALDVQSRCYSGHRKHVHRIDSSARSYAAFDSMALPVISHQSYCKYTSAHHQAVANSRFSTLRHRIRPLKKPQTAF
jgi:hypothetical protein